MATCKLTDPKVCPLCGKLMLRTPTGVIRLSYPGQLEMKWWCGCGHREDAPSICGDDDLAPDNVTKRMWEVLNGDVGEFEDPKAHEKRKWIFSTGYQTVSYTELLMGHLALMDRVYRLERERERDEDYEREQAELD